MRARPSHDFVRPFMIAHRLPTAAGAPPMPAFSVAPFTLAPFTVAPFTVAPFTLAPFILE